MVGVQHGDSKSVLDNCGSVELQRLDQAFRNLAGVSKELTSYLRTVDRTGPVLGKPSSMLTEFVMLF